MIATNSIDFGLEIPSAPVTPGPGRGETLPAEAVEAFSAAMDAPLRDNATVQNDFALAMKAFAASAEAVKTPEGSFTVEAPRTATRNASVKDAGSQGLQQSSSPVAVDCGRNVAVTPEGVLSDCVSALDLSMAEKATPETLKAVVATPETSGAAVAETAVPTGEKMDGGEGETLKGSDLPADHSRVPGSDSSKVKTETRETPLPQEAVASLLQPAVQSTPVAVPVDQPTDRAVEAVAARTVETVARVERVMSASEVLVAAATEVADAILVTPGLMSGEGEVVIRLRADVLDGSEVRINVSGRQLGVEFMPVMADTAAFIERHLPQLQQHLVARVHSYTVGVSVRRGRDGRA